MSGKIRLRQLHPEQQKIADSRAKRRIIRAGRRGGKTTLAADIAVNAFLDGRRVLYAVPTQDQVDKFWTEVIRALQEPLDAKALYKNETRHLIEVPRTERRIRAKTAWDADTLRGDFCDLLILDEYQLMNEDTWELVGAPMLLDNDGDAIFIYTPPSLRTISRTKARDPRHAAKLWDKAKADPTGRWAAFHFASHANPHISTAALSEIVGDMTALGYRQEILAEDVDEAPGALWKRAHIEAGRVSKAPQLARIVIGVDPSATSTGDEAGIVAAGIATIDKVRHGFVLGDASMQGSPAQWAGAAVRAFGTWQADRIVAEVNNGGEMVELTIRTVDGGRDLPVTMVHASRGKATRAEPVAALYERGLVHHVGALSKLEDEMCLWSPGAASPNRMDAAVWALTELMVGAQGWARGAAG